MAIFDKFERTLERIGNHKEALKDLNQYTSKECLRAYFLGLFRALAFDMVGALENKSLCWEKYKELAKEALKIIEKRIN